MRCFTRLTNVFSKKVESRIYDVVIYFIRYNFVRSRVTLRCTPVTAAEIMSKLRKLDDMVYVLGSRGTGEASVGTSSVLSGGRPVVI